MLFNIDPLKTISGCWDSYKLPRQRQTGQTVANSQDRDGLKKDRDRLLI